MNRSKKTKAEKEGEEEEGEEEEGEKRLKQNRNKRFVAILKKIRYDTKMGKKEIHNTNTKEHTQNIEKK